MYTVDILTTMTDICQSGCYCALLIPFLLFFFIVSASSLMVSGMLGEQRLQLLLITSFLGQPG